MLQRREAQDYKDRDYDSDDDIKKEMMTYDDRLTFINKVDHRLFGKDEEVKKKEETKQKEEEINKELNEKEIPES